MIGLPQVLCCVTFLSSQEGGRDTPLPPGAFSGNGYRPHLVVGDPMQRGLVATTEDRMLGVAFCDGPQVPVIGQSMNVAMTLIYHPHVEYEELKPDVTFTIREGARIVAFGRVATRT